MFLLMLLVFFARFGRVRCYSRETFLVVSLTIVITGFILLIMIIYVMLVMQRRSGKVCYVQRSPQAVQKMNTLYTDNTMDSVTWARWERRRYDMRRAASASKITTTTHTPTPSPISTLNSLTLPINHYAKRPSTSTILPVTYIKVNSDGEQSSPPRPTPIIQEEYVCY